MSVQNKFFTQSTIAQTPKIQKKDQREELLNTTIAEYLNQYKNFGVFASYSPATGDKIPYSSKTGNEMLHNVGGPAVRSIFNKYSAVLTGHDIQGEGSQLVPKDLGDWTEVPANPEVQRYLWERYVRKTNRWRVFNNTPLMDTPAVRTRLSKQANRISVKELVKASEEGLFGRLTYSYADFMYCKYLNKVSNNYLITLRRFPSPILDSLRPLYQDKEDPYKDFGKAATKESDSRQTPHPIGTMVTWLGTPGNDMNTILKYDYKMAFEESQAQMHELESIGGGESGILNALEGLMNKSTRESFTKGEHGGHNAAMSNFMGKFFGGDANGPYQHPVRTVNKVYGPIDRIQKNYIRKDTGLEWNMKFSLTFEYELRAYNGINPRQAMLDLIASILAVTYTNGSFWKGGFYPVAQGQTSTFRNLNIFKAKGGWSNYMDALAKDLSTGTAKVQDFIKNNGGVLGALKSVLNAVGGLLMGGLLNKLGRPRRYKPVQLLSEAPSGLWHITIGNPWRPIVSMGNMILTGTEITHSGPLGMDDFPTNLKVVCSFDRGKPRDTYGVEQMYMNGNDRVFHSMSKKMLDMYQAAHNYSDPNPMPGSSRRNNVDVEKVEAYNSRVNAENRKAKLEQKAAAYQPKALADAEKAYNTTGDAMISATNANKTLNDSLKAEKDYLQSLQSQLSDLEASTPADQITNDYTNKRNEITTEITATQNNITRIGATISGSAETPGSNAAVTAAQTAFKKAKDELEKQKNALKENKKTEAKKNKNNSTKAPADNNKEKNAKGSEQSAKNNATNNGTSGTAANPQEEKKQEGPTEEEALKDVNAQMASMNEEDELLGEEMTSGVSTDADGNITELENADKGHYQAILKREFGDLEPGQVVFTAQEQYHGSSPVKHEQISMSDKEKTPEERKKEEMEKAYAYNNPNAKKESAGDTGSGKGGSRKTNKGGARKDYTKATTSTTEDGFTQTTQYAWTPGNNNKNKPDGMIVESQKDFGYGVKVSGKNCYKVDENGNAKSTTPSYEVSSTIHGRKIVHDREEAIKIASGWAKSDRQLYNKRGVQDGSTYDARTNAWYDNVTGKKVKNGKK